MVIVLIGPSGAGKGTQADRLSATRPFLHLSTGDLFRDHLRRNTAIGRRIRGHIDRGELVPEEITEAVLREALQAAEAARMIILDGYPRTEYQATRLDELERSLHAVIYLKVSEEEVVERRIPGRLTCELCDRPYHERASPPRRPFVCDVCGGTLHRRADDTPPWARARLRVFHRQTAPVVDHYQKRGKLIVIDGEGSIEEVESRLLTTVDALERRQARRATAEEALEIQALRQPAQVLPAGDVCHLTTDVVLLGAPGSGKGTQAKQLHHRFRLPHISTGDLFREHVTGRTELGQLARTYMERGALVPDDLTESMVRERLRRPDTGDGFILDGFPRTVPQAEALTDILTDLQRQLSAVVYIDVADETIVHRLSGRWICVRCQTPFHEEFNPPAHAGVCDRCGGELRQREDDRPETVRARLRTFHRETAPLVDYYRRAGLLVRIPGQGEIQDVSERTIAAVDRVRR